MQENTGSKKKILYIITKGNFGGAQKYVYDLATSLPPDKFEAVVACGEGEALPKLLEEKSIRVIRINKLVREISVFNEFKVCGDLINLIRSEKPDVIHLNSSKIGGIGAVAGRLSSWLEKDYRPKIIFTSHGWGFYEKHRSFLMRLFYYPSHWLTIILCDETVAVSEKTKNDIDCLPFISGKIKVIYNGIEKFEVLPTEEARKILGENLSNAPEQAKTILFSLSELHHNKGIDIALKAISLLPDDKKENIIYCVAGDGEEKERLDKLANDLGINKIVRFLGFVKDGKKLLLGADIFLFPSRTENLPFAILEAGLVGLPIITTCAGGIPEIIRDMQNGIMVHRENSKETAEAILYLLDHKDKQEEFGEEIKKTVSNFFSLGKMLGETIQLYQ